MAEALRTEEDLFWQPATWPITLLQAPLQVIFPQFSLTDCNNVYFEAPIIDPEIAPSDLFINHEAESAFSG